MKERAKSLYHTHLPTGCDNSTPRESNAVWHCTARHGVAWRGAVRYGTVHRAWHDTLSPSFMHNVLSRRRKRMRVSIGRRERVISLHKDEELRPVTRREREIYFHKKVNCERHGCLNLRVSTCLRVSPLFANVRWKIYPLFYDGYPAVMLATELVDRRNES